MRSSGTGARAIRQWWIGVHELAGDLDAAVALRERVERRVDRALERVLDRHERALHAALADRRDGVVDGRERDRLEVRGRRRPAPPPRCRSRPGRGSRPSSLQRGGGSRRRAPAAPPPPPRARARAHRARRRPACSRCGRCRGGRSRRGRRRCARRRAARSSSTGSRSAPRRRRSGPASGTRSRRRAAPPPRRAARRRSSPPLRPGRAGRRRPAAARPRGPRGRCRRAHRAPMRLRRAQPAHADGEHEREQERDQRHGTRRQRGDARRIGQVVHGSSGYERTQPSVKRTSYSAVLLSVFSSPGTFATVALTVTAAPTGGALPSVSDASAVWPRAIGVDGARGLDRLVAALDGDRDLDVELVVLALVGELDDDRGVGAGRDPVGRVGLQRRVADRDALDPGAVQARRGLPAVAGLAALLICWPSWAATVCSLSHSIPGRKREVAIVWPPISASSSACCDQRRGARLVEHVGGQERLHLARRSP